MSSLRRAHVNLLCSVPISSDDSRRESDTVGRKHKSGVPVQGPKIPGVSFRLKSFLKDILNFDTHLCLNLKQHSPGHRLAYAAILTDHENLGLPMTTR